MGRAIGIDLGTTRSVVATIDGGKPRVLPNSEGQLVTPSVVAMTSQGRLLVGQPAREQALLRPEETVASIKRYMGSSRRFRLGALEYAPQELSAFILRKLKRDAEACLGEPVEQAVISVPAYFNDLQRQATRDAGLLAGLKVLRLISEPTAAALAYGLEREDVHTILVWDLGGGTFDVSILELGEGVFEVRAVSGDNWLGGEDFDRRVMDYLAQEYERLWRREFPRSPVAWERLREAAERAKIQLSALQDVVVRIPLPEGEAGASHLETVLTRVGLEGLVADLLDRLVPPVRQALADAALTPGDIDRVILVGNGTKMPAVRRLATDLLGQEPYRYIDPDLVVAVGAAVHAGVLLGLIQKVALLDVLPLSLGIETQGGLMARVIPRNTPLPACGARIVTTAADHQTSMEIHVLQGEREMAVDNVSLGRFELTDIPAAPRGMPRVEVAIQADVDGIIHVSATELLSEREVEVKLASTKLLAPQEIDHLVQEAQARAEEDRVRRDAVQARMEAENLVAAAEMALERQPAAHQPGPQAQRLALAIAEVRDALASGSPQEARRRCAALRQLLAESDKAMATASASDGAG